MEKTIANYIKKAAAIFFKNNRCFWIKFEREMGIEPTALSLGS